MIASLAIFLLVPSVLTPINAPLKFSQTEKRLIESLCDGKDEGCGTAVVGCFSDAQYMQDICAQRYSGECVGLVKKSRRKTLIDCSIRALNLSH